VGATSQEITGTDAGTLRDLLIAATTPRINESQIFDEILQQGIDSYVPTVQDEKQVTVRTLTFESSGTASDQPILVTGTTGTGEDDSDNPNRQEALVIDVRNLPSGSVLQFDKVEFAIVIGAIKIQGGEGRNFVVGDDSAQYIVLGEGDDLLRGGAGDDTIGSGGEMTACSEVMVTTPFLSVVVRTCYTVAVIAISSPTRAPWINMSSRTIMVRC
jgi:hypothetical protein